MLMSYTRLRYTPIYTCLLWIKLQLFSLLIAFSIMLSNMYYMSEMIKFWFVVQGLVYARMTDETQAIGYG